MPAPKPAALIDWNRAKTKREEREAAEAAMTSTTQLPSKPPKELRGDDYAREMWKRLMELYTGVEGNLVNAFDQNLLVTFCKSESEISELLTLRNETKALWKTQMDLLKAMMPQPDALKDYFVALGGTKESPIGGSYLLNRRS